MIVAGDLTATDKPIEYDRFNGWLKKQKYRKKIVVAGNHDKLLQSYPHRIKKEDDERFRLGRLCHCHNYLCDSGTEFEGLKIWGSPWSKTFEGMNPKCKAFTMETEEELAEKWALIPDDIDILITHSPPWGILDKTDRNKFVGSCSLRERCLSEYRRLHVFGHIHEQGGKMIDTIGCIFVNASHVNEHYQPVNKPIRIVL